MKNNEINFKKKRKLNGMNAPATTERQKRAPADIISSANSRRIREEGRRGVVDVVSGASTASCPSLNYTRRPLA